MRYAPLNIFERQPGTLRRMWCEATGGHWYVPQIVAHSGSFRTYCAKCGVTSIWYLMPPAKED